MTKKSTTAIVPVEPTKQAIATAVEAGDVDTLKHVRAMASGLQKAAKARGVGIDKENQAAEIVLRSERGIGTVLIDLSAQGLFGKAVSGVTGRLKAGEGELSASGAASLEARLAASVSTEDLGITKQDSSLFQRLANIPDAEFEERLAMVKSTGERIAKVDFYRLVRGQEKVQKTAMKGLQEELAAEDETSVLEAFRSASLVLIADMDQLPTDELVEVAGLIQQLASAYTAAKQAR